MSTPPSSIEDAIEDDAIVTNKRRSGRATRKPETLYEAPAADGAKRKRAAADDDEQDDEDEDMEDEEDSDPEEDDEPAEEEVRDKATRKARAAPKKPAAKRPKTNGEVSLPIRPTASRARRPTKKKAKALDTAAAEEAGGLYAEVFARGHTLDDVVAEWIKKFSDHEAAALADLINFTLRCAGCEFEVSDHDIEDPDGCVNKLGDLQEEFQAQNVVEYPIISKSKGAADFKKSVTGFFYILIKALHASNILLVNIELIENIQVWLSGLSAANNRPFRHTATVISLSIVTALCEVGRDLLVASAKSLRHSESERKNKKVNKSRVSALQEDAQQAHRDQSVLDTLVKDWFNTVYIHRYRDIDPRIRVECVQAIGEWIAIYPDVFFESSHLRYLGWMLSDSHAPARLECVKQLHGLYQDKDRLAGLKTFTERFRARIVEMATLDSEASVRAATVELLDLLRQAGYLEPDDIDAIGRLIFDTEPRVRKAVVDFFAESVNDTYESKLEDLGGLEAIEEDLPEVATNTDSPGLAWLKLKCLAEMLDSYDGMETNLPPQMARGPGRDNFHLHASFVESRFIIAAESLYSSIPSIREWEPLAAYLLFDSSDGGQNGVAHGVEAQLKEMIKLSEKEEAILLEVLNASVKGEVAKLVEAGSEKKGKKTKKQREQIANEQEEVVRHLATLVPRLLKRFGDAPQTASVVLRLERIVNLEAFEAFHQDASEYSTLLDDINKQFLTHGNEEVLTEASRALLRAKNYHELGEVTDEKIEELWEETISTFVALVAGENELTVRGTLSTSVLDALSKTVSRIERLATISRPIEHLEAIPAHPQSGRKSKASSPQAKAPLESLIALIQRGDPTLNDDSDDASLEDSLALHAAGAVSFYMLWSISSLKTSLESSTGLSDERLEALANTRDTYISALVSAAENRPLNDDLTITIAGMLLDVHAIMATLRQIRPRQQGREDYLVLALEMDKPIQKWVLSVFGAAEAHYAKLTNRTLDRAVGSKANDNDAEEEEEEDLDAEPIDTDAAEPEASDDGHDADGGNHNNNNNDDEDENEEELDGETPAQLAARRKQNQIQRQLVAEQRLCELAAKIVLAVLGGMMDTAAAKKRLERNKNKLGNNFKEVLKHLEINLGGGAGARKVKGKATTAAARVKVAGKEKAKVAAAAAKKKKSEEVVLEDDDDEDEDEDDDDDEALRRRGLLEEQEDEEQDADEQQGAHEDVESVLGD